ncbi:hypothetical protein D3C78_1609530 [compost metagenome]
MKMNKEWHIKNPMPKNPTFQQRMEWHLAHSKHCQCRPIPIRIQNEIKQRSLSTTLTRG